jgi:predicted phage terminase large subunit-like protein
MAEAFDRIAKGTLKRLILNLPPRHTKSEYASYLLPAYLMGRDPRLQIIEATHTAELAVRFGRKVRDLMDTEKYMEVFSDVKLKADSKAAGRWDTNRGGSYFAVGVGGAVTGRGADLLIIDDPHALEITTPIPTPKGFVEIQDLKVGDQVFGPDGHPIKVIAKSEVWHDRELYSVVTDDNEEILCDAKHLWGINSDTNLAKARVVNQTAEYLANWQQKNKPILPKHEPVQYPQADLPIDPWVLGAWLGDGTTSSGRITAHPDDQPYMIEQFKNAGYEVGGFTQCGYTFTVYGLHTQLKALGVLNNKHVPPMYLTASESQRMALLQGLIDTDGSVIKTGQAGFYNANPLLVRAVVEILHSLGVKCQMRSYEDTRGRWGSCKTQYRVMFRLEDCARMPRKRMYSRTPVDKRSRSITVEATGVRGSVQCITVDRPDGLFLAGRGYVVTHNSEQDAMSDLALENAWEWYQGGPRTRLQPGGAIVIVMTRWGTRDLTARLLKAQTSHHADKWEVIEFPAILPSGKPLWPEFWKLEELEAVRASLSVQKWNAMYQQQPTNDEGAILKREWWRRWEKDSPPAVDYIIQSYDTAYSKKETADFSVISTWGVFFPNMDEGAHIILLGVRRGRWDFPELKRVALDEYKYWNPDNVLIEAKATGVTLQQEMRRLGIPVTMYTPGGRRTGTDKVSRANAVAPILESGLVWAPETAWADELVEECASFPNGDHDDMVDSTTMALMRFRQGNFIALETDERDDETPQDIVPEYY